MFLVDKSPDWTLFVDRFQKAYRFNPLNGEFMLQPDEFVKMCGNEVRGILKFTFRVVSTNELTLGRIN